MTRDWREQLAEVGIFDDIIDLAGLRTNNNKTVEYPLQYPPVVDGNEVFYDTVYRTRVLQDELEQNPNRQRFYNPKQETIPDGEMPLFYTPNYTLSKKSINLSGGHVFVVEGDKDLWTMWQAGYFNTISILAAGARLDDRIGYQLSEIGVRVVQMIPDSDNAGWNLAQKLQETLNPHNITTNIYHLPYFYNDKKIKDVNDLWFATNFVVSEYTYVLEHLKKMKMPTKEHIEASSKSSGLFDQRVIDELERQLGVIDIPSKGDGWTTKPVKCIFHDHEEDDTSPAAGWNRKYNLYRCFKCGDNHLMVDVLDTLGIDWKQIVADDTGTSKANITVDLPSINKPVKNTETTEDIIAKLHQNSSINLGTGIESLLANELSQYNSMPATSFTYDVNSAIGNVKQRLLGEQQSKYPPIINPLSCLHHLGGAGLILHRPFMVGVLGTSGGFKCIVGDTRVQTEHGLVRIDSMKTGKPEFSELGVKVMTPNGEAIATHFYDSGVAPTKKITTRFGYELQGTYVHPVYVLDKSGKHVWKQLSDIKVGDFVAINRKQNMFGNVTKLPEFNFEPYHSNMTTLFDLPDTLDTETAYVIGALIGDGGLTHGNTINFSSADSETIEIMRKWFDRFGLEMKHRSNYDYSVNNVLLKTWLKHLGVSGYSYEKNVPEIIYSAPKEHVKAFLQGIFDTDGHASNSDKFKVNLVTTSEELAYGVQQLLLMFGIVSKRFSVKSKKGYRTSYRVLMRGIEAKKFFEEIGFKLTRKQNVVNELPIRFNTNVDIIPYLPIVDYTKLPGNRGKLGRKRQRLRDFYNGNRSRFSHNAILDYEDDYFEFNEFIDKQYFYDEVTEIIEAGEEHCYDISVPDGNWFIANGFVSHNTSTLTSIVNYLSAQGHHGIVWSPEWTKERAGDRIVQQAGGMKMDEMLMLELAHYKEQYGDELDFSSIQVKLPDDERINKTWDAIKRIEQKLRGNIVYIDHFGSTITEVLSMLIVTYMRMVEAGQPPSYFVLDYVQLAGFPKKQRDWSLEQSILLIKQVTNALGIVTFVASQVRKSDTEALKGRGKILTSTSGVNLYDNSFNLFLTVNPSDEIIRVGNDAFKPILLAVTKNSNGQIADNDDDAISIFADLNRMLVLQDINDPDSEVFALDNNDEGVIEAKEELRQQTA